MKRNRDRSSKSWETRRKKAISSGVINNEDMPEYTLTGEMNEIEEAGGQNENIIATNIEPIVHIPDADSNSSLNLFLAPEADSNSGLIIFSHINIYI
jgi:hypothetical protein